MIVARDHRSGSEGGAIEKCGSKGVVTGVWLSRDRLEPVLRTQSLMRIAVLGSGGLRIRRFQVHDERRVGHSE